MMMIGPVQCGTCGSVYSVGDPVEEESHQRIHQSRLDKLRFPGWKLERVVREFPAGRVVCVKPGDHSSHWRKVEEVLSVVDSDLGFSEVIITSDLNNDIKIMLHYQGWHSMA